MKLRVLNTIISGIIFLSVITPTPEIIYQVPDTIVTEDVTVNTENAVINVDNTIIINGEVMINGTILRSINNRQPDSYFRPSFSQVDFIKDKVMVDLNKGVVYTGEFDLDPVSLNLPNINRREYEILGRDTILEYENYSNSKYATVEMPRSTLTRKNGIMALYKAIGTSEFDITLIPRSVQEPVDINSSPLLDELKTPAVKVNNEGYYTDVFITRTVPEVYWSNAEKDGIILKGEDSSSILTIGEFSQYLASMLHLKGEPVLTTKEESILLATYGVDIPYYLPGPQTEAVKYLMARGIVDNTVDFKKSLDRDTMLTLLSRAKDESSRLTFKEITIPYNEELVAEGFYPTETELVESPIINVRWNTETRAVQDYYDYFIKIVDEATSESLPTVFKTESGNSNYTMYVSSVFNSISEKPFRDSSFVGVEGNYFHFKVPINIVNDKEAFYCQDSKGNRADNKKCYYSKDNTEYKGYITINSSNLSDIPGNLKVEYGGGVYLTAKADIVTNTSNDTYIMNRTPFSSDYSTRLVDRNRKLESQEDIIAPIPLSSVTKATLTFQSNDVSKLMWDGKPLEEASVFAKDPEVDNQYTITLESSDPYRDIMALLTTTKLSSGNAGTSPAYIKDNRTALVSLNYLRTNKVLDSAVQLSTGKCPTKSYSTTCGKYMLYGDKSNILVDTVNRIIVAGQTVIEIPEDDPSPLIIPNSNTGEYLIDARAVQAVGSELFVVKSSSGSVAISMITEDKPGYKWSSMTPFLGDQGSLYIKTSKDSGEDRIYLEDTYPLSNYLIYKSRSSSVNEDFLIVFKPKIVGQNDTMDVDIIADLKDRFHIELGSDEVASIYPLGTEIVHQKKYSSIINLDQDDAGYYYTVPKFSEFNYYAYLKGLKDSYPLAFVKVIDGSYTHYLDMNMNVISGNPFKYPASILSALVHSTINPGIASSMHFKNSKGYSKDSTFGATTSTFILAPAGVQSKFYPKKSISWMEASSNTVYVGTMLGKISSDNNSMLVLKAKGGSINFKVPQIAATSVSPFDAVFRGTKNTIYVYNSGGQSKILDFSIGEETIEDSASFLTTWGSKSVFDWLAYKWENSLEDADDIMTIIIIFLLNILPRVMLFWLFGFSTLVLIRDIRFIQYICASWFDFYKILSFGLADINKVTVRGSWISGFFAIVLLSLMNTGDMLDVFAWIFRSIYGILNR